MILLYKEGTLKKKLHKVLRVTAKKNIFYSCVCFESNLLNTPNSIWCIDSSTFMHINNNL